MTKILYGKAVAKQIYQKMKSQIQQERITPRLVVIFLGNDPAAAYYVKMLEKKGKKTGMEVITKKFSEDLTTKELLHEVELLNNDSSVHGIMLQKPLPPQINETEVILNLDPCKDVDGFHPLNIGKMVLDEDSFLPSTPAAVLELIRFYDLPTEGKNIVILGRSNIVGKPLANLFLRKDATGNATVRVCHSRTRELEKITGEADILVAAIGVAEFVNSDMVSANSILIDVGINKVEDDTKGTKYVGDIDYEGCFGKVQAITPVPGGIGTITTAMLLRNVLKANKNLNNSNNFIDGNSL